MNKCLSLCPEDEKIILSGMSAKSLFFRSTPIKGCVLCVQEISGCIDATYSLRTLISEKALTIQVTIKNPVTQNFEVQEHRLEGPCSIFLSGIYELDDETASRFLQVPLPDSESQTRLVFEAQKWSQTIEGIKKTNKADRIIQVHRKFQKMLNGNLRIVNPYSSLLNLNASKIEYRRIHAMYLSLIESISIIFQYQRSIQEIVDDDGKIIQFIEVTLDDIKLANEIIEYCYSKIMQDELTSLGRDVLEKICELVNSIDRSFDDNCFTRRELKEKYHLSTYKVHSAISELAHKDMVTVIGRTSSSEYKYCLLRGVGDSENVLGLKDVKQIEKEYLQMQNNDSSNPQLHTKTDL
jgi:hypothetical protein